MMPLFSAGICFEENKTADPYEKDRPFQYQIKRIRAASLSA